MSAAVTVRGVQDTLAKLADPWSYPADTVDTIKTGDPDTVVEGIAVAWLPFTWALEDAVKLGCNLFITHEPTYYNHRDDDPAMVRYEQVNRRQQLLDDAGMVVLRCHDMWDRQPDDGITDQWAVALGFTELVGATEYARCYEVPEMSFRDLAAGVANATAGFGQPGVQLIGAPDRRVSRVVIGTGAISPYLELVDDLSPDLIICSDDGLDYWRDGAFASDGGPGIVVVNHGVTEEPGVARLAEVLATCFPALPVHHIAQRCMYEVISG